MQLFPFSNKVPDERKRNLKQSGHSLLAVTFLFDVECALLLGFMMFANIKLELLVRVQLDWK